MEHEIIKWLLAGDPSIKYQTSRDLLDQPADKLVPIQKQIEKSGWGSKLLSFQEKNGMWGGGLYGPKWISTHYTLMTLMRLGLSPNNKQAIRACELLLDKGFYRDGGINHFASMSHSETCVTGMTLSLLCYFNIENDNIHSIYQFLLDQQMKDGGWNCESFNGATHSSFHTTISTLEGLRMYEKKYDFDLKKLKEARGKAHEFLLCHHLFRSDKTAKIVNMQMTRFSFPPRWKYDVMRALDYFQDLVAPHDPRFCDAITLLKKKEKRGKWPLQQKYSGRIFFEMEKAGKPSRMNTLRALRILNWWHTKPDELICS